MMVETMISDMDEASMSISRLRRQCDRAFADWYALKKETEEFAQQHDVPMPSYMENHFFTKSQKRPYQSS